MLRNADAIAVLAGEAPPKGPVTQDVTDAIDRLTTLYAFRELDDQTRATTRELMGTEAEGMNSLVAFHRTTRQMELERRDAQGVNDVARLNGWKGHVPSVAQEGASVIVADDMDEKALVKRGYVRIGTYQGDKSESYKGKRSYYQTSVGGKGAFRQGVAQTVNETWLGVDAKNGVTLGGETAGVVGGQKAKRLARRAAQSTPGSLDGLPPGEMLMPLLDENGDVVSYERSMDPKKLEGVKKDQHLGRMLGVWAGRILEEEAAHEFNATLVNTLKEIHDKAVKDGTDKGEFVNVADKDHPDPVVRDAWNALGWRIKAEAEKAFGGGVADLVRL